MKDKILKILKNSDEFISGEKLSHEFNMTRSGIWKYINMLKEQGYQIESIPRRGYRIISSPDILTLQEIEEDLNTEFIGRNVHYYDSIESTNDRAKELALESSEGTVIISEEQTKGKGRLGREWISPKKKGIWMSLILKPSVAPLKLGSITLLGAAAVHNGLEEMGIESKIKWPNDILLEDKKISGILTEISAELNMINYLIMGIGINVNLDKEDFPKDIQIKATSIKIYNNKEIDRKKLLANILNEFERLYIPFKDSGDMVGAIDICRKNSATIGREIVVSRGKDRRKGKALDINDEGELVVQFADGEIENVFAGEVSLRGIDGYI